MGGLVVELQQAALNEHIDLTTLIRKALVVSNKLDLADVAAWLQSEINGYPVGPDVPDFRQPDSGRRGPCGSSSLPSAI